MAKCVFLKIELQNPLLNRVKKASYVSSVSHPEMAGLNLNSGDFVFLTFLYLFSNMQMYYYLKINVLVFYFSFFL